MLEVSVSGLWRLLGCRHLSSSVESYAELCTIHRRKWAVSLFYTLGPLWEAESVWVTAQGRLTPGEAEERFLGLRADARPLNDILGRRRWQDEEAEASGSARPPISSGNEIS